MQPTSPRVSDPHVRIELLPAERGAMIRKSPPTSTVTFFRGSTAEAERYLRGRVAEVVDANPWLASVLERDAKGGEMAARHPARAGSAVALERRDDLRPGRYEGRYHETVTGLAGALCRTSERSVGTGAPLWRASIVPDAEDPEAGFALVVSANHSLLDGHDFYRIYGMLSGDAAVEALSPVRKPEVPARILEATGGEPSLMAAAPAGFLARFAGGMVRNALFPATTSLGFLVDRAWVERQKADAASGGAGVGDGMGGGVPWVSTNDVLVSTFFRACEADCATMAVNFRGRVEGCGADDVGNYEDALTYLPADFATPALVRRSVTGPPYVRAAVPPTRPLTNLEHLRARYAVATNWATFARPLRVEGARETLHLPLFDFPASTPASVLSAMVIFDPRPGGDEIACLCGGSRETIRRIEASGMVGGALA